MSADRIRPVTMPKWGIEMQEGTVTAWNVELGRHVDKGDALLDVEGCRAYADEAAKRLDARLASERGE